MDLKDVLNDGAAGHNDTASLEEQRPRPSHSGAGQPSTTFITGSPSQVPPGHGPPSAQHPAFNTSSSASPARLSYGQPPTPIRTASQAQGAWQQYPPPSAHHLQSPVGTPHYRPYEGTSATTPLARPPSHGYPFPHTSASQHSAAAHIQSRSTSSLSPTPPANQSPYAHRQSPQVSRGQILAQPQMQHQYQHAQPSTPLGPPTLYRQPSSLQEAPSPLHQRNFSATSNGNAYPGNVAHAESPAAYSRPPSQQRHSGDHHGLAPRERSESVSPKTKVPPRPPSLESRRSSFPEHSGRASVASSMGSMPAEAHRHVMPTAQASHNAVQHSHHPLHETHPHSASEVPQRAPVPVAATPSSLASDPSSLVSRPALIHHSSSKMGMDHLLSPANEVLPHMNGSPNATHDASMQRGSHSLHAATPLPVTQQDAQNASHERIGVESSASQPADHFRQTPTHDIKSALKRSADSDISEAPPAKHRRVRKYAQPPLWARLSKHNAHSHQRDAQATAEPASRSRQTNGSLGQQGNGVSHATAAIPEDGPPWTLNPPLDHDLIHARRVLGEWEKTFKWNTPYPDVLKQVQDWLFEQLNVLQDVARDPREGSVEIEAKLGTLFRNDGSDTPYQLPVRNACVLDPHENSRLRFESTMTAVEHKHMNLFLNDALKATIQPGRIQMKHHHPLEVDSFHHLSTYGLQQLPASFQKRRSGRPPRLRISRDNRPGATRGQVLARIVKIPISNLHLYNPGHNYDCRISINLEVNLDRPDIDFNSLIDTEADVKNGREVDRIKDRIEYKHLAYSIDLTKVAHQGLEPSHELELEVNSNVLREQMALMREGKPHAFGDVVAGFLDNATFLMRMRPPPS